MTVQRWYRETLKARNGADLKAAYVLAFEYDKLLQENYQLRYALRCMLATFEQDGLGDGCEGDAVDLARRALASTPIKGVERG